MDRQTRARLKDNEIYSYEIYSSSEKNGFENLLLENLLFAPEKMFSKQT